MKRKTSTAGSRPVNEPRRRLVDLAKLIYAVSCLLNFHIVRLPLYAVRLIVRAWQVTR